MTSIANSILDELALITQAYNWLSHEYDPAGLQRVENAQRFLKKIFMGDLAEIEVNLPDIRDELPILTSAIVKIKSRDFFITDTKQFSQIKDYCDFMSIVPYTDGTIGIEMHIDNVIRKVERG